MANDFENTPVEPASITASRGVIVITNDQQSPADNGAFKLAADVAARTNVPVTLYDRSEETWGDSQHPEGPLRTGDDLLAGREHLSQQIAWFDDQGVVGQGWVATLPTISAVLTALAQLDADVVVVPERIGRNLFERLLAGGSIAEAISEQIRQNPDVDATVVEVAATGDATKW